MDDERPSKTQRKKQMHDLQALGAELVELNERELATLALPERLLDAVKDAQHMTKFEARRRQLQYIGKLMRDVDPEPIRRQLAAWKAVSHAQTVRFQRLEQWRTRLMQDEAALAELARECPQIDPDRVRTLVSEAQKERAGAQPPRSYRALFQLLNEAISEPSPAGDRKEA